MKVFLVLLAVATSWSAAAAAEPASEEAVRESVLRLAAGDVPGAREQAQAAVASDPRNSKAYQQLARAASAALDFPAAEQAASRAMELEGLSPALLCLRSEARAGRGDYVGALGDAVRAAEINPGSAQAILRRAVAMEGLGLPPEEVLVAYRRAAELDAANAGMRDAAIARLSPSRRPSRRASLLLGLLAALGFSGWAWARSRRKPAVSAPPEPPPPSLPKSGKMSALQALLALKKMAPLALNPQETFALASDLYECVTGLRPAAGEDFKDLPEGMDFFFERALHADPDRRFRTGEELLGAFRSIVDPAIH